MTDDLKQRLRDDTRCLVSDITEAADQIEELEREVHLLRIELKDTRKWLDNLLPVEKERDALQADNARLREALKLATTYHEKKCDCAGCKALAKVRKQ